MKNRPLSLRSLTSRLTAVILSFSLALTAFYTPALAVGSVSGSTSSSSESSAESSSSTTSSDTSSSSSSQESSETSSDTSDSETSDGSDTTTDGDSTETDSTVDTGFTVNSTAVYLVNLDSGTVIYEKNADLLMYPASLVKIMTCLLAIENCDDLEGTVVTSSYTVFDNLWGLNASNAGLYPGEELRMIDLLYALMLRSGCDAAGIIAEYISSQ